MTAADDSPHIGLVVEGRGEIQALPLLLRKWLRERGDFRDILGKPVPCNGRANALKLNGIEGKVAVAAARPGCRAVLVVLDGEGDAVCRLGPKLLVRSRTVAGGKPVAIALADVKYESWLIASTETLDVSGLKYSATRDPVSALEKALLPSKYIKPVWQPRLTQRIDFGLALPRSRSLKRFLARFDKLLNFL
jgi:hypothetical protein